MNTPPVSEAPNDTSRDGETTSDGDASTNAGSLETTLPQGLCQNCKALNITPQAFVVTYNGHESNAAKSLVLRSGDPTRQTRPMLSLRSGIDDIQLLTLAIIASKAETCRLCKLISDTVKTYSTEDLDPMQTTCQIRWEVDGHEELKPGTFQNRTRRLRLIWGSEGFKQRREAFFVMVASTGGLEPNSDTGVFKSKGHTFKARQIHQEKGRQALIKSWLDICQREHQGSCDVVTQRNEFEDLLDETYFGVIDVTDLQLKPLPKDSRCRPAKYAALSYVWAKSDKPYTTRRVNVPWRRQHGGLEAEMSNFPAAIQDAIRLTQQLNLRYLWVDALCIVQDSATSFKLNTAQMHTIYGNAHFTICAADGEDATTGLLAMGFGLHPNLQDSEEIVPGVRLQVARPPEMVMQDSKWNTRGWTFQERILSRRCVIFAGGRAYFQCRKAALSEDVHNDSKGSGWSLQAMGAPLRYFPEMEKRSISFYMKCVSLFYRRDLTRPSDILAAFKGIQSVMELVMRAPFCYGLPTSHFDLALLWQPSKAVQRRAPTRHRRQAKCTAAPDGTCDCSLQGDDFGGLEFPSWSWCGWIGGDVCYDPATLEGCLINVREWLAARTWIRYHILNGRGQLRPLWDREQVFEDRSLEARWKGYAGVDAAHEEVIYNEYASLEGSDTDSDTDASVGAASRVRPGVPFSVHERDEVQPERDEVQPERKKADQGYEFLQAQVHAHPPQRHETREEPNSMFFYPARHEAMGLMPTHHERALSEVRPNAGAEMVEKADSVSTTYGHNHRGSAGLRDTRDSWGRPSSNSKFGSDYIKDEFKLTHPENPYKVRSTEYAAPDKSQDYPDLPVLQFWTMRKMLQVICASSDDETGLSRCHVGDAAGDWCGTVVLNTEFIQEHDGEMFHFVALSEAKSFTSEENPIWTYYLPKERAESEWDVFYALLVVSNKEKHVWERIGLAKIFGDAFQGARWDEIMLG